MIVRKLGFYLAINCGLVWSIPDGPYKATCGHYGDPIKYENGVIIALCKSDYGIPQILKWNVTII